MLRTTAALCMSMLRLDPSSWFLSILLLRRLLRLVVVVLLLLPLRFLRLLLRLLRLLRSFFCVLGSFGFFSGPFCFPVGGGLRGTFPPCARPPWGPSVSRVSLLRSFGGGPGGPLR